MTSNLARLRETRNCPHCGKPVAAAGRFCPACGTVLQAPAASSPGACGRCGAPMPRGVDFCPGCGSTANAPAPEGSLLRSLENLGLGWLGARGVTFLTAMVVGLIVARALPYLYDPIFGRIVSWFVGTEVTTLRDNFNVVLMTALTFGSSFAVAFFSEITLRHVQRLYTYIQERYPRRAAGH